MSRTGVRINRRAHYVRVESATARNTQISYRALGLLTYLLDQSEEWQVRSEQLCQGEGREGRDAIRRALRELAAVGHYRLERRRFRDGKQAMGTALSEFPVKQWAEDHITFEGKPIPVLEQEDRTFLVRYPDGSLGSDGFEPGPDDRAPEDTPAEDEDAVDEPKAKPTPAAKPSPAKPSPAKARAATKTTAAEKQAAAEEKAAQKKALDEAANKVATWWWEDAEKHLGKYVGAKGGFIAMRKQVLSAMEAGYTQRQCADALRHARQHWPSRQQWQTALGVVTNHVPPRQLNGRIPYSDAATWGTPEATTTAADDSTPDDDDAQFGVLTD
ncbi:hypothetical protein [Streptomyces sp. NPDC000880]